MMGKIIAYVTMPHPPIIIPEVGRGEEKKIKNTYDACTAHWRGNSRVKTRGNNSSDATWYYVFRCYSTFF